MFELKLAYGCLLLQVHKSEWGLGAVAEGERLRGLQGGALLRASQQASGMQRPCQAAGHRGLR